MLIKISKSILINPLSWRILGIVSSIVASTCFAMSPSFYDLFGRWNLFKAAIYSIISLSVITMMLFVNKCRVVTRSVMVKSHVVFLVLMLTSLCSIWQDLNSQKDDQKMGSRGRLLNMFSFVAFGLMSLSLSRQLELGFEVGISNFLFGSFLVLLMKMNFKLAPLAAILCYVLVHIRSLSDFLKEMRGRVDSSGTLLEDIETGIIDLQPLNVAAHLNPKNKLKEYAERSRIALPIYQAVNVGLAHAPNFRSAVSVDGKSYISEHIFPNAKDSEQNVAKLALQHITTGVKDEGLSLILEKSITFKSLLNDYAQKMNVKIPYFTHEGLDGFLSTLILDGESYTSSEPAKTKRDAEQSAACAAILTNLENFLL